jgi:hypothetical protein
MQANEELTDVAISAAASKVTYAGSASVGIGWLMTNEAAVFFGILIGIGGLLVNWWYKRKADKREEELHSLRIKELNSQHSRH